MTGNEQHRAVREIIWHFTCGHCANWWSYATMETGYQPQRLTCPHCGTQLMVAESCNPSQDQQ